MPTIRRPGAEETRDTDINDGDAQRDDSDGNNVQSADGDEEEIVESVGGADAMEEVPDRTPRYRRQYKIQEVIKRRQIMLVQVVKEERGTKGAALTTYLVVGRTLLGSDAQHRSGRRHFAQDHQFARPRTAEGSCFRA